MKTEQKYFVIKDVFENNYVCLLGHLVYDVNNALLFRDRKEALDFLNTCIHESIRYSLDVVEIDSSELSDEFRYSLDVVEIDSSELSDE